MFDLPVTRQFAGYRLNQTVIKFITHGGGKGADKNGCFITGGRLHADGTVPEVFNS